MIPIHELLSRIRLGIHLGRLPDLELATVNRLLLQIQTAHLQSCVSADLTQNFHPRHTRQIQIQHHEVRHRCSQPLKCLVPRADDLSPEPRCFHSLAKDDREIILVLDNQCQ